MSWKFDLLGKSLRFSSFDDISYPELLYLTAH
jgi:hypothetical protein